MSTDLNVGVSSSSVVGRSDNGSREAAVFASTNPKPEGNVTTRPIGGAGTNEADSKEAPLRTLSSSVNDLRQQKADLEKQVQELQEVVATKGWYLNISQDKTAGKTVIKLHDKETGDLIRQIPSEEMLSISRRFKELELAKRIDGAQQIGLLFDQSI